MFAGEEDLILEQGIGPLPKEVMNLYKLSYKGELSSDAAGKKMRVYKNENVIAYEHEKVIDGNKRIWWIVKKLNIGES